MSEKLTFQKSGTETMSQQQTLSLTNTKSSGGKKWNWKIFEFIIMKLSCTQDR